MTTPSPYSSPYQSPGVPPVLVPTYAYASWIQRVGAYLIDQLIALATLIPMAIGLILFFAGSDITSHTNAAGEDVIDTWSLNGVAVSGIVVGVLGFVFSFAFGLWNVVFRQGGPKAATLGKSALGLTLVKETTGKPVGAGISFLRQVLHVLDSAICYLGYLWPLWDAKRQTISDKCVGTVVVRRG